MADKCPGTVVYQRFPGVLYVPNFRLATLLQHVFLKKHFATDEIIPSGFVVKACFEAFTKESASLFNKVSRLFFNIL